ARPGRVAPPARADAGARVLLFTPGAPGADPGAAGPDPRHRRRPRRRSGLARQGLGAPTQGAPERVRFEPELYQRDAPVEVFAVGAAPAVPELEDAHSSEAEPPTGAAGYRVADDELEGPFRHGDVGRLGHGIDRPHVV